MSQFPFFPGAPQRSVTPSGTPSSVAAAGPPGGRGPRGCPGPRGPAGPQPPLSDAVDSSARDTAASSLAVKTVHDRTRVRAAAALTLYVRAGGDNSADGLSEATALATIRGALDRLAGYDMGVHSVTIDLGEGEFASPGDVHGSLSLCTGASAIPLIIEGKGKDSTVIRGTTAVWSGNVTLFRYLTLRGKLRCVDGATVWLSTVRLLGEGDHGLSVYRGASVTFQDGGSEIVGVFDAVFFTFDGMIMDYGNTLTVGDVTCSVFASARHTGLIVLLGRMHVTGVVSGRKWALLYRAVLLARNHDPDAAIPGSEPGGYENTASAAALAGLPRAGARISAQGLMTQSYGVASCTRTAVGTYQTVFRQTAAGPNYSVVPAPEQADPTDWSIGVTDMSATGLTFLMRRNGVLTNSAFSFLAGWEG